MALMTGMPQYMFKFKLSYPYRPFFCLLTRDIVSAKEGKETFLFKVVEKGGYIKPVFSNSSSPKFRVSYPDLRDLLSQSLGI